MPGALLVLFLVGGLGTACSSGSSTATTTRPTHPATSTTARTSGSTAPPGSSTASTSTAPAGPVRCPTTGLSARVTGTTGAAGTLEVTVALTHHGATCVLTGYPGLQLLGPAGASLPTNVVRGGSYPFTGMTPTTVTLTDGQSAYFNIGYSDVPVGGETTCPTSTSLEITPPDATDHLVASAALAPCAGGTLVVSPVFAAGGPGSQTTAPPSG